MNSTVHLIQASYKHDVMLSCPQDKEDSSMICLSCYNILYIIYIRCNNRLSWDNHRDASEQFPSSFSAFSMLVCVVGRRSHRVSFELAGL